MEHSVIQSVLFLVFGSCFICDSAVYVVCRHGNDSQKAVLQLRERLRDQPVVVKDIIGGLTAWTQKIDPKFPTY